MKRTQKKKLFAHIMHKESDFELLIVKKIDC